MSTDRVCSTQKSRRRPLSPVVRCVRGSRTCPAKRLVHCPLSLLEHHSITVSSAARYSLVPVGTSATTSSCCTTPAELGSCLPLSRAVRNKGRPPTRVPMNDGDDPELIRAIMQSQESYNEESELAEALRISCLEEARKLHIPRTPAPRKCRMF